MRLRFITIEAITLSAEYLTSEHNSLSSQTNGCDASPRLAVNEDFNSFDDLSKKLHDLLEEVRVDYPKEEKVDFVFIFLFIIKFLHTFIIKRPYAHKSSVLFSVDQI